MTSSPKSHRNLISASLNQINNLPIFTGLSPDTLTTILKNSCINNFKKGQFLFLEGDKSINLYVILEGWVKLFKNNPDGKELILEMMTTNQALSTDSTLFNSTFVNSAQVVEDARILVIPKKTITSQIRTNWNLAENIMSHIARRSIDVARHLSDLALKNVVERISWFLFTLFNENHQESGSVKLPYDKSLIACYLGMKPETFSRGLNELKERNLIRVEKNLITMLQPLEFNEEF